MNKIAATDVVIVGGGISGLWLLNRLRQQGLGTILLESNALGHGQTLKSQGIIHGGMKYALQGLMTPDAKAVAESPAIFKACLAGEGEIDLSQVSILSNRQYLWSPSRLTAKLTAFFAGAALQSGVQAMPKTQYPQVFQHERFTGDVYALDEIVLDVPALVRALVKNNQDAIFHIEPLHDENFKFDEKQHLRSITIYMAGKAIDIQAQYFIFTAGAGNEALIKKLPETIAMQRRPLHMVLVDMPLHYPLYGHCLSLGPRPRVTITTHKTQTGRTVWYLGGQIAEEGVGRDQPGQIKAAKAELNALFPWLNFKAADYFTFMIDRAEPKQASGLKPESVFAKCIGNVIVGWPTKLCLAPKLAATIMGMLKEKQLSAQGFDLRELRAWPMPPLAIPIWEEAFCKNVA